LQVEKVPVDEQDFATEADEWAHLVADNRIAELAETDGAMLKDILGDLDTGAFDMDVTGFDNQELERVINFFHDEEKKGKESSTEPKQSDDDYSMFQLVMLHKNKTELTDALNEVKEREGIETNEDALMVLVRQNGEPNR